MRISEFNDRIRRGKVSLDGGTARFIQEAGLPPEECAGSWIFEHPQPLMALQRAYAAAGCDIVCAPTHTVRRAILEAHGLADQIIRMNAGLVALSREAVEGRALIAGAVASGKVRGPLDRDGRRAMFDAFREQFVVIAAAAADLLAAEPMDTVETAVCAAEAARDACGLPVMCALSAKAGGQLQDGSSAAEAAKALAAAGACAVGLVCNAGPDGLSDAVAAMKDAGISLMVRAGAGVFLGPEAYAEAMLKLAEAGADVLGGCGGAGPEHMAALVKAIRG